MPLTRLPNTVDTQNLGHAERFLYEVERALERVDLLEPPTIRLFNCIRTYFADGCSIIMINEGDPSIGDSQVSKWLIEDMMKCRREGRPLETIVSYDKEFNMSYLATPISSQTNDNSATFIVMWKNSKLFFPQDILAVKVAVSLYFGHHLRSEGKLQSSPITLHTAQELTEFAEFYGKLKGALDGIPDIMVLFGASGELIWLNKSAKNRLEYGKISTTIESEYDQNQWLFELAHPEDIHLVMEFQNRCVITKDLVRFKARLLVSLDEILSY